MAGKMTHACVDCGKVRQVEKRRDQPVHLRCQKCAVRHWASTTPPETWRNREGHPRWKGGRHVSSGGYVRIVVPVDDPLICMADKLGRIYEHRLVMARSVGRPLDSSEHVHHRNGNKQDNRLENLQLTTLAEHSAAHHQEIATLRLRVQELESELARLQDS